MGIADDLISGIKNSLKWQAQSAVVGGVSTGIKSVVESFKNKCPKCGKQIKEVSATFCPNCGASRVLICKNTSCGRQSPIGIKFCPSCGSNLQSEKSEDIKPS